MYLLPKMNWSAETMDGVQHCDTMGGQKELPMSDADHKRQKPNFHLCMMKS
jgi:hypothetical protein